MFTVVHAQISSTSRVLRSAWTGVSRGDCIFPFVSNNLAARQKQEEGYPPADWVWIARGYFQQQTRPSQKAFDREHHSPRRLRAACFARNSIAERNKLNQDRGRTGGSHENDLWNCRGDAFLP